MKIKRSIGRAIGIAFTLYTIFGAIETLTEGTEKLFIKIKKHFVKEKN